jgi:hypothetical protein
MGFTELERALLNALRDADGRLNVLREIMGDDQAALYVGFIRTRIREALDEAQGKD